MQTRLLFNKELLRTRTFTMPLYRHCQATFKSPSRLRINSLEAQSGTGKHFGNENTIQTRNFTESKYELTWMLRWQGDSDVQHGNPVRRSISFPDQNIFICQNTFTFLLLVPSFLYSSTTSNHNHKMYHIP